MTDPSVPALTLAIGIAVACACHRLGADEPAWRWVRFAAILSLAGRVGQALLCAVPA